MRSSFPLQGFAATAFHIAKLSHELFCRAEFCTLRNEPWVRSLNWRGRRGHPLTELPDGSDIFKPTVVPRRLSLVSYEGWYIKLPFDVASDF